MPDDTSSFESNYAGRWVARVRGRIIAQGDTPELARRAAKASRPKENPEIIFMNSKYNFHPLVEKIKTLLPEQEIYLVGGAVRDMFLNRFSHDLDFAVPSSGISLARTVAAALHADFMILDEERDTGRVIFTEESGKFIYLDFATFRVNNDHKNPADILADLRSRDFTINAIAYDLRVGNILDPTGGEKDILAKMIRACSQTSFSDDSLRILRAVRQAAAFEFHIDLSTRELMKESVNQLSRISQERLRDELFKMLAGPRPEATMRALEMLGVFPYLLPEITALKGVTQSLPHVYDVWTHTLAVLKYLENILAVLFVEHEASNAEDMPTRLLVEHLGRFHAKIVEHFLISLNPERSLRALFFFIALYHDVCKPQTKTVEDSGRIRFFEHDVKGAEVAAQRASDLRLSNNEAERVNTVIVHHMRFHFHTSRLEVQKQEPSRKAIYRFFRDAGDTGVELILLGLADLRGTRADTLTEENWLAALQVARIFLENYFERREEIIAPPRLLNGNELMKELDISPGPMVGKLLEDIREEQAAGKVSTRIQALEFAREQLKGMS